LLSILQTGSPYWKWWNIKLAGHIIWHGIVNFAWMKKSIIILFCLLSLPVVSFATHNRAGEITFKVISGYTYEVTVTTFTYIPSQANRLQLNVEWGDNTQSVVNLNGYPGDLHGRTELPNDYYRNEYTTRHTFPGPGIYQILMQDPNRNYGIKNIPNSVDVIFSIKSILIISPEIGYNSTPLLLNFPIDKAARGHIFIHNPSAFDPDGDSLSYKIAICTGQDGRPIADYSLPGYSDTLYVDPIVGDLIWYTPIDTGKYNVAMNIEEWRYGVKIGNITRDIQIDVYETDNNPPVNPPLYDLCIEAGDIVEFQVTTTDADNDSVRQTMVGGPLVVASSPATFTRIAKGLGFSTSIFRWQTSCDHIRKQPWQVTLKGEDKNSDISLIDIDNFNISVMAPAPDSLESSASSTDIRLNWHQADCGPVRGYYIYRREGSSVFNPDSCEKGVPAYTGFTKIGTVEGKANNSYTDDNNGEGLIQGIEYCYRVTAFYQDGNESYSSKEICNTLVPGFPSLLNVSVTRIDPQEGDIFLSWAKPRNFDPVSAPGPYLFRIYRSITQEQADFELIDSIHSPDLNDTTYIDSQLNTVYFPYYYSVKMYNNTPGNRFEMRPGENETASSLYIDITPDDNRITLEFRKKAPWINEQYVIYRRYNTTIYDSLTTVDDYRYVDEGLKNGETYYYQVKSIGWRPIDGVIFGNSNLSHENYGTPVDLTPPCAPLLEVESKCDSVTNFLTWTNPNRTCADDVIRYNVYYSPVMGEDMDSLTTLYAPTDTFFYHRISDGMSLAGCYAVSAIDSFGNKSPLSPYYCVDNCGMYELPNVFTPNDDGINDFFISSNVNNLVQKVDMKIFNRYGQLVKETSDPAIKWDGKFRETNNKVPSGVYYYICDVYEPRISGVEVRTLVGFIHVYAEGYAEEFTK
jgi:gliding motility-associated-like protein